MSDSVDKVESRVNAAFFAFLAVAAFVVLNELLILPDARESTRWESVCELVGGEIYGTLCLDGDVIIMRKGEKLFEDSPYWVEGLENVGKSDSNGE